MAFCRHRGVQNSHRQILCCIEWRMVTFLATSVKLKAWVEEAVRISTCDSLYGMRSGRSRRACTSHGTEYQRRMSSFKQFPNGQ